MAENDSNDIVHGQSGPYPHLWSRDGFLGTSAVALRANYVPSYKSVTGPHAPHRLNLRDIETSDFGEASGCPSPIMVSKAGLGLSVSRRTTSPDYTTRNVEADELHFVQFGKCRFDTDYGSIEVGPLDLVCIPRAVSYRIEPVEGELVVLTLESPGPLRFDTPAPFGMINFGASVRRAVVQNGSALRPAPHRLRLRADDGYTIFEMDNDPLQANAQVAGVPPVWALNLSAIQPISYGDKGGPPAQFLSTESSDIMIYTLGARPGGRPPIHHNADYDEIVIYAGGPGAWGKVDEPGTLTWVPKGVTHHGPVENVPEGYSALLIETRPTLRLTDAAKKVACLMETDQYGRQP